jgi:hypothetical protein
VTRAEALFLQVANLLVAGTGLLYAWALYLAEPSDPFAVVNHPWQPHFQHLHVLAAPFLLFAVGLVWRRHVAACWRLEVRERHRSGATLAWMLAPMALSGYLLQTAVDAEWRRAWLVVHLATSGLWVLGYAAHQLGARLAGRRPVERRSGDRRGSGQARPA